MRVVVHVDGGARGNPGPAAVAAVATSTETALACAGSGIALTQGGPSVRARPATVR